MPEECIFCRIASGEIPSKVVFEDDELFAFRDINPVAPTHILVIPKRHIPTLLDLRPGDAELVGRMILLANRLALDEGIAEKGFRLVLNCNRGAGQSVFHIHLHLIGGRDMEWPPG